jgi:hypothetical protein
LAPEQAAATMISSPTTIRSTDQFVRDMAIPPTTTIG